MRQIQRFRVVIEPPRAGWLPMTLDLDGEQTPFHVSYLSDALGEFIRTASALAERRCRWGDSRFVWLDEPGAWEWNISVTANETLAIRITRFESTVPNVGVRGTEIESFTLPGRSFCRSILRAADSMGRFDASDWRYGFPEAAVQRLRNAIRVWPLV